jgi:hypothetical protein
MQSIEYIPSVKSNGKTFLCIVLSLEDKKDCKRFHDMATDKLHSLHHETENYCPISNRLYTTSSLFKADKSTSALKYISHIATTVVI